MDSVYLFVGEKFLMTAILEIQSSDQRNQHNFLIVIVHLSQLYCSVCLV